MQYSLHINQKKAIEWQMSMGEAILFGYLINGCGWARALKDNPDFKWVSNSKLAQELPLVCSHHGSARRHMKALEEKGLVKRLVAANKGYFKVTDKGMAWSTDTGGPNQSVGPAEPNESVQAEPDCAAKANESVATKPNESVQRSYIPLNQINQNQEKPLPDDVLQKKWKGYLDSRKEKRRTMNEAALSLAVDSIGRVVKDGYKLVDILDSMTVGGWQTVTSEYMQGKAAKKKTFKPAGQTTSTDPLGQNTAAYEERHAAKLAEMMKGMVSS